MKAPLISDPPANMRQRPRKGGWRIWWEPNATARRLGFQPVELDARRLTWSIRQARALNDDVSRATDGARITPQGRTLHDLIQAYLASPDFSELRPGTQRDYQSAFRTIGRVWASALIVDFDKHVLVEWYENLFANNGRYQAKALIAKMSVLMSYADRRGWRDGNPCLNMKIHTPAPRSRVATWDEQDRMIATADRLGLHSVGTAIILSAMNGLRATDCLRLAPKHLIDGSRFSMATSKRGTHISAKLHPETIARIRAHCDLTGDEPLLIFEGTGRRFASLDQLSKAFSRIRAATAGDMPSVADLKFRDFRRTFSARSHDGGATTEQVGNATGNTIAQDPRLRETYIPPTAASADHAVDAIRRPDSGGDRKEQSNG